MGVREPGVQGRGDRPGQARGRALRGGARIYDGDSGEARGLQDPRVVPEQAEGLQGWQVLAALLQRPRHEAPRRPRAPEEDPQPPRSSPLLGYPRARAAHEDHRPPQVILHSSRTWSANSTAGTRVFANGVSFSRACNAVDSQIK